MSRQDPKKSRKAKPSRAATATAVPNRAGAAIGKAVGSTVALPQHNFVDVYGNTWRRCQPLSEDDIQAVERELQISIPQELRALFLACNGGCPVRGYYHGGGHEVEMGYLLPLRSTDGKREPLETKYRRLVSNLKFPTSLVPFAYDTGNANIFCVNVASGEVVYWLHDALENPTIAPSLNAFLSRLQAPPY